jgi:hypothetical protein
MLRRERGAFNSLNPSRNPLSHAPLNKAQIGYLHEFFFDPDGNMSFFCYVHCMEFASISRASVSKVVRMKREKVPGVHRALTVERRKKAVIPHNKTPPATVRLVINWALRNSQEVPDEFKIRRFLPPCISKRATYREFRAQNPTQNLGRICFLDILRRCCSYIKVSLIL